MPMRIPPDRAARFLRSPDLLLGSAHRSWRKQVTSRIEYRRPDGVAGPPAQVDLRIIESCNLRCKMCSQWGESGYDLQRPREDIKTFLRLPVYEDLAEQLSAFSPKPWIYIWGGEPFLHPELMPILECFKKRKFPLSIVTNGTRLRGNAAALVAARTDVLMVSLDGTEQTHDRIRGMKGAFATTVDGIRAVQEEKKKRRSAKPYIGVISVVSADNQDSLEELFETAEGLDIDFMMACYGWYQTDDSGARYTKMLQEALGVTPWSWKGWQWNVGKIDPEVVAASVSRIKERRWNFTCMFFPDLKENEVGSYYHDHSNTFGHNQCRAPWYEAAIMPNGDMVTCRDYPDVPLGNIRQTRFLDIWNSPRAVAFRQLVQKETLLPVCTRCTGLMCI
jgi:radical SAM protein with 4Fe4S-binding SPASM domain